VKYGDFLFIEPTTTEEPCGLDKTDVIFVVDASTSVTEANFKKQLEFMKSIVEFADVDTGNVLFRQRYMLSARLAQ
jgi:collagen type VI alpha